MIRFAMITVLVSLGCTALAAEPQAPHSPMSLKEAMGLSDQRNPDLQKLSSRISEAQANVDYTRSLLYPTVTANGQASTVSNPNANEQLNAANIVLRQDIYDGGLTIARIQTSQNELSRSRSEEAAARHKVRLAVIAAYFRTLLARETLKIQRDRLFTYDEFVERFDKSYKLKAGSKRDFMFAALEQKTAIRQKVQFEKDLKDACRDLALLLNVPEIDPYTLSEPLLVPWFMVVDAEKAKKAALDRSKDLEALKANGEVIEGMRRQDLSKDTPALFAQGTYEAWNQNTKGFSGILGVSIPLFSGLSSIHKRRVYSEREEQNTVELEKTRRQLGDAVDKRLADIEYFKQAIQDAELLYNTSVDVWKEMDREFRLGTVITAREYSQLLKDMTAAEVARLTYMAAYRVEIASLEEMLRD